MPQANLIADLGGTNARFALTGPDFMSTVRELLCANYASLAAAIDAYLGMVNPAQRPRHAAMAIAGPVIGDRVTMTNYPAWAFSISELRQTLSLDRLEVINDFAAVALAIPRLTGGDRKQIGGGTPEPEQPIGVLGAGTGLGVSSLVRAGGGNWIVLAGEGGHVTMPAVTEREAMVLSRLHQRFPHVSAERVISGQGLVNLHKTLSELEGKGNATELKPDQITNAAIGGADLLCIEAVAMFCAMLGTVAGNLALTVGARGGIYIAGGIVPKLGRLFFDSEFRARFENKGRLRDYLKPIPAYLVTHEQPGLLGLEAVLEA